LRKRRLKSDDLEDRFTEQFRAVIDNATTLTMYNEKKRSICVIKKNLAKDYEIEVDASEAPVLNKLLKDPEPYESSIADVKILEKEIFPLNDAFKNVFGSEDELKLHSIKLAVGGSQTDYVTIRENDLKKFDVSPTLSGLSDFIDQNSESIIGFLDCEYISEEGNIIYLNCGKKNVTDNIYSLNIKILASMQQRGFFLQQEHKWYGLQLYITLEMKRSNDDKLLDFLKELNIDWELIFFRRRLAIHDWTEIECEKDSESLKKYLRAKHETLNFFDINNIIRIIVQNQLPFKVADKMASLLHKMKLERVYQIQDKNYDYLEDQSQGYDSEQIDVQSSYRDKSNSVNGYTLTLKKAEIAAAANIACAYLGVQKDIEFDKDISLTDILKYQEELTNF
jgi:hypothetical protein